MVRIDTPTKPMGSSQDPAASARAAAARELQTTISNRHAAAPPTIPSPFKVKSSLSFLKEKELRTILDKVIDQSPDARVIIQAYCKTPVGSVERPFDFAALHDECLDITEIFEGPDWDKINSDFYEEEKAECMRDVRRNLNSAIYRLHKVSKASSSPIATKSEGLRRLFELVDLMQSLDDLCGQTGYFHTEVDHQIGLVATAFDAIQETIQALTPARQAQSSEMDLQEFDRFVKRCEELAPLVEGVDRDWDEDEI
jgi:hypothetical protein